MSDRPTPEEERIEAWEYWHQRARKLEALLHELISIEGPQPGTAEWADRVRAALEEQA